MMKTAVLFISHGSFSPQAYDEVRALVKALKEQSPIEIFEPAFLEINSPNIPDGIERCVTKGAGRIILLLNFLNSGKHVLVDIPTLVAEAQKKYPHVLFFTSRPVGLHPKMQQVFLEILNSITSL